MALIQGFDSLCKIYPDVLNHESEEYYPVIQYLADFTRNILQLHSDSEMIKLSTVLELSRDTAYSIWKYNSKYGFVPMKETNIEI